MKRSTSLAIRVSPSSSSREPVFTTAGSAACVFIGTFVLRWLPLDFENDYFMHMAWAAEMLRGQWPVRDFVEPGFPLQTWLAYAGLRAGGYQLSWEGFVACALIAASTTITYVVCRQLGIPRWLSLSVAALAALTFPRLYAYPKAFVYPAALWALLGYLRRSNRRALVLVAAATAVAFLFRHDHGVWIAIPTVVALALHHWAEPKALRRAVVGYGIVAALLVSPWLAWVAASGHAGQHWDFLLERSTGLANRAQLPVQSFDLDPHAPLLTMAPIDFPIIGIRWASTTSSEERRQREQEYSLNPLPSSPDRYRLTNLDSANVRALVLDAAVEDTSGIDRGSLRVPDGAFAWIYLQLQRYVPLIRLRILPGVIRRANAQQWLTNVTFVAPWIVLAAELVRLVVKRRQGSDTATTLIVATAVLSIIVYQTLVRTSPDSRLGDIVALTAILLARLIGSVWAITSRPRLVLKPMAVVLLLFTVASAASYGQVVTRLGAVGVDGPTNMVRRLFGVGTLYGGRPLDLYAPQGATGLAALSRWLNDCTLETDRVSIIGFEPQVFFLAERGFAGGLAFYDLGWNSSERDQELVIERWSRQDVPVVFAMEVEWQSFSRDYPAIRAWIDQHYTAQRESTFGGDKRLTVLVSNSYRSRRTHASTGLPCFR